MIMAYDGFAINEYPDAEAVCEQLDALKDGPIYGVKPEALKEYEEEYFEKKCQGSKTRIEEAKKVIPGGVQHNLAFNYPFAAQPGLQLSVPDGHNKSGGSQALGH